MATINKRGSFQYQAIVRKKGFPSQTKTFETYRDAKAWVGIIESEMTRGVFVDRSEAERTTLGEALNRYLREVTPSKKSAANETGTIRRLLENPLALRSLASLSSCDFALYRDGRGVTVGGHSVRLELAVISNLFTIADQDWGIKLTNPILKIRKPKLPGGRTRRLEGDEEKNLKTAAQDGRVRTPTLLLAIELAIETGMRSGEIVELEWHQIDLKSGVIRLEETKNGTGRIVPLTLVALNLLKSLPCPINKHQRLTTFHDANGVSAAFRRACKRAGISGLHLHDLRHEAASRFAPHMPMAVLAKVMGWKTLQMAMRYYNPTENELVDAVRFRRVA
jgi:integrase